MEIPRLNLSQLITFYLVAREQSYTAAAKKLCLTEPAVSQQLKTLEKCAKANLICVKSKKVQLTETGHILYKYAEEIYRIASEAETFIRQVNNSVLRVAFSTSFSSIIAIAAAQFQNLYPNIELTVRNMTSQQAINELADLQHDLAIIINANINTERFERVTLAQEKLALVTGWTTPIGKNEPLTWEELSDQMFILPREGSAIRSLIINKYRSLGIELKKLMIIQMDYLICSSMLAEMGKGVAAMPEFLARREVTNRKLRILRMTDDIVANVDALFPKEVPQYQPAKKFANLVRSTILLIHSPRSMPTL